MAVTNVPAALAGRMVEVHGAAGTLWLEGFSALAAACEARWSMRIGEPLPNLSYAFVAEATLADGTSAVFKAAPPHRELATEAAALRICDGRGMVRLLESDMDAGVLLLERVRPGLPLTTVGDDSTAARIAAQVMRKISRPAREGAGLPAVADWVRSMEERSALLLAAHPDFPGDEIDSAVEMFEQLSRDAADPVVLHGDLHHDNILSSTRDGWIAIDPKGIVGEPAWETTAFMINPRGVAARPDVAAILRKRMAIFAEELGIPVERIRLCTIVRCVLSAFWSMEDHGGGWDDALHLAETLKGLSV